MQAAVIAGFTLLLVAGCAVLPTGPAGRDAVSGLRLDSEGLQPTGTDLRIDFGRAKEGVLPAVTRLLGAAPSADAVNAECGAGPVNTVSWDGLDLTFMNGDLGGWITDAPAFVAASGLRVGMTRAELEAAGVGGFEATGLGTEFGSGGVFGLIEGEGPAGEVTLLWSGLTCFFR